MYKLLKYTIQTKNKIDDKFESFFNNIEKFIKEDSFQIEFDLNLKLLEKDETLNHNYDNLIEYKLNSDNFEIADKQNDNFEITDQQDDIKRYEYDLFCLSQNTGINYKIKPTSLEEFNSEYCRIKKLFYLDKVIECLSEYFKNRIDLKSELETYSWEELESIFQYYSYFLLYRSLNHRIIAKKQKNIYFIEVFIENELFMANEYDINDKSFQLRRVLIHHTFKS